MTRAMITGSLALIVALTAGVAVAQMQPWPGALAPVSPAGMGALQPVPTPPPGYLVAGPGPGGAMLVGAQQGALPAAQPPAASSIGNISSLMCDPCSPGWSFFADAIYICPRNQEVAIAVPADGPIDFRRTPVQNGPTILAEFGYEPGFRLGGSMQFTEHSRLRTTFTWLEATTNAWGTTNPPLVMWPMVTHPEVALADRQFLDAGARYLLDIELFDADWVRVLNVGPYHKLDFVLGARYAGLSQELRSYFIANTVDRLATDVNYNGGGIRVGLEGEWFDTTRCWLIYARSAASFTAGEFRCGYRQDNNLGQRIVDTSWKAGRVVSMLDLEIGLGWQSPNEAIRLSAGYMFSGWYNAITVPEYIEAVQNNSYVGIGDFMTFDGLVGRLEVRF